MSASSLTKRARRLFKKPQDVQRDYQWKFLLLLPLWLTVSFFLAQVLTVGVIWLVNVAWGMNLATELNEVVFQAIGSVLTYALTLLVAVGVPYIVRQRETTLETLGLQRLMSWVDIGLAPLAYVVYALLYVLLINTIMAIVPAFPLDQAQDVGFQTFGRQYELMIGFMVLVVIGPIAEEALFRGYLYGKMRLHVPAYAAILATSALFALAHGQWNVAVDTFALGIVLGGLREITGSIWAGVLLHMIKNAIAFYTVFISPFMIGV